MTDPIVVQRLLLITLLAGLVGFERERHGRAAGLRTHILVGMGSCLIMLTAIYLMEDLAGQVEVDPTRMAGQVISGIGFLGAGTILRFRASVRGLTTAASLWAVAGIGLAVGAGFIVGAAVSTGLVLIVLFVLGEVERRIRREWFKVLMVESRAAGEDLVQLRQALGDFSVEIRDLDIKPISADCSMIEINLKLLSERDESHILEEVSRLPGTRRAHWA